jgi:PQQ-dependent dehydrogenase (methanol/ethanol family)
VKAVVAIAIGIAAAGIASAGVAHAPPRAAGARDAAAHADVDWPSYNRTLGSDRYVPLAQIDRDNVARLQPLCRIDLGVVTSFQTGPLVVAGTMYLTTEKMTAAFDAATCAQRWRVAEKVRTSKLRVNRGAAFLDGRLFRGLQDGRVVAYDAATGRKLWQVRIADDAIGESVPAAPIAWHGMVFIGQAGGDNQGVKGRMVALDATTGRRLWQTWMVPREEERDLPTSDIARVGLPSWSNAADTVIAGGATWTSYTLDAANGELYVPGGNPAPDFAAHVRRGEDLFSNSVLVLDARSGAYRRHFSLVPEDFHDWDVAAAPVLARTRAGTRLLATAPKDGLLYGIDLGTGRRLYATALTTRFNVAVPLTPAGTRFCPGMRGGTEWNGPAYDPRHNLLFDGTVDWCMTVALGSARTVKSARRGRPWTGATGNHFGKMDPQSSWRGWLNATDADSGVLRWRFHAPAPIVAGVTPTAGGLVFTADMHGNAYAFDAAKGTVLWRRRLEGAAGGGVVSYSVHGRQLVAFVHGTSAPRWHVPRVSARVTIFALPAPADR